MSSAHLSSASELSGAAYLSHCLPEVTGYYRFGGWASCAAMCADLVSYIITHRPKTIVECGSGLTTLFAAAALRRNGSGRIYALEHLKEYRALTGRIIKNNRLDSYSRIIEAPLVQQTIAGMKTEWYDSRKLSSAVMRQADLLIIDGPPQNNGPLARFGAIKLIQTAKTKPVIFIDDIHTDQTKHVLEQWRALGLQFKMTHPSPDIENYAMLTS